VRKPGPRSLELTVLMLLSDYFAYLVISFFFEFEFGVRSRFFGPNKKWN
jgi:hypothetical protein